MTRGGVATGRAAFWLWLAVSVASPGIASAETVERNLPPEPVSTAQPLAPPNLVATKASDKPIDGPLSSITFLGVKDGIVQPTKARRGIDAHRIPGLDDPQFLGRLAPFLGRPVSLKLIADIEAAVATWYREKGRPFVSVSTPQQEVTGGVLQFRVVEFHVGKVSAQATGRMNPSEVIAAVRAPVGEPVDAKKLAEDLDWLNRSPFRTVEAEFSPGVEIGATDLVLKAIERKPWQVYGGYSNSGSQTTDWDRYFVGAIIGDLPVDGALAAYQLTASPDFWYADGEAFGDAEHPRYVSHGGRFVVPTLPRQDIEGTVSFVETNEDLSPFAVRTQTLEGSIGYRTALSNFSSLPGEIVAGVEAKRQTHAVSFGGLPVSDDAIEVYQLYGGWTDSWSDAIGKASAGFSIHVSPGDITADNSDAVFGAYSSGRVTDASYAYLDFDLMRLVKLGEGWTFQSTVNGQVAGQALPDTEQIAIGGASAVRGYTSDDGSFDAGVVARNELRAPAIQLGSAGAFVLSPFALIDVGYGRDEATADDLTIASAGVGADLSIGNVILANISAAYALTDATVTKAGDWRADVRVTAKY